MKSSNVSLAFVSSLNHAFKASIRSNLNPKLQSLNSIPQYVIIACPHVIQELNKYLKGPENIPVFMKKILVQGLRPNRMKKDLIIIERVEVYKYSNIREKR